MSTTDVEARQAAAAMLALVIDGHHDAAKEVLTDYLRNAMVGRGEFPMNVLQAMIAALLGIVETSGVEAAPFRALAIALQAEASDV